MAQSLNGYTLTWSGTGEQNLQGVAGTAGVSAYTLLIRANNAGIHLGGYWELTSGPGVAYELVDDREYTFRIKCVPGTNQENSPYVKNPSGGSNSLSYLIIAE